MKTLLPKLSSWRAIALVLAILISVPAAAQNLTVRGKVIDESGAPLPGAGIVIEGTTNGTTSDVDGNFTISVKPNSVLVASFIGFESASVKIGTSAPADLKITLMEDKNLLNEVVVTALGLPKQAKSVGYATTRVSTDEIERANVINPVNALQGKVAGLQINAGGASGITSSSSITIRGAKSVDKNNSPIFVIDGMIIQEAITGNLSGTDWGSQLKNLNPADYESVTVLKGAAATALYGSRGANGAIVIVSKGGKYGKQGLGVEVNQTVEITDVYKSPVELQNIYGAGYTYNGYQGDFQPDGSLDKVASLSWGPRMDGRMINQYMPNGENTPFSPHKNNWKEFYQTGINNTTNVAISGGGEKSSFRLSYGYNKTKGVFLNNDFQRHNISFRGNTELNSVFSVELGVKYAFSSAKNGASQGGWDWGNNVGMLTAYYLPRNIDIASYYDQYRDPETKAVESTSIYSALRGYFHTRDTQLNKRNESSILADLTLHANIAPWLRASLKSNYNYYGISTENHWVGTGENYGPSGSGGYGRGGNISGNYNFMGMLQMPEQNLKIAGEDFTVAAILAAELYGNTESHSWSKETNGGLVVPGVFSFSNSVNKIEPQFSYTPANQQTFGLSGILNLGWRDQVFLELTARNDWLSTLTYPSYMTGKNNYSVFYPSANLSWVFTDSFRNDIPQWFSFGKIRASIARVGMGTSAYATSRGYGVFNQSSIYLPDKSGSVLAANPNLGTAYNEDLKPEIQQSIELGFDTRFFDERVNIDFAWYKSNTYNQIMSVGSVAESGASTKLINAGNIQNKGIELQLDVTPIRTSDWRWTVGGNLTVNRGKVVKLDSEVKEWQLMGGYDAAPEIWAYENGAFGVLTSYQNGSYMSPLWTWQGEDGDPRNGKMIIQYYQEYGSPNSASAYYPLTLYDRNEEGDRDRHILGKVEPDFTLSLNTSLSYKNLDLYVQADGRFGGNYFSNMWKYAVPNGSLKSTLEGRDKEHGGIARINYKGETVYDGLMLDAVFAEGTQAPTQNPDGTVGAMIDVGGMTYKEAVEEHNVRPVMTGMWYALNYGWGMPAMPGSIQDNTWFALREITVGYRLPEKLCKKFGANYLRLGFTARNICYIINKLTDGLNPAAISSNNPLQPMDIGGVPFYRTYALNLTVRF